MPNFVFSLNEAPSALAARLVEEALVPMFRKLHHERSGWNLSLINVAATNMAETATESKDSYGRDIGRMFRRQDEVLKDFRVIDEPHAMANPASLEPKALTAPSPELPIADGWESDDSDHQEVERCGFCQNIIPSFASAAHQRYHELGN